MAFGATLKKAVGAVAGKAGKAIDTVGRATNNFSLVGGVKPFGTKLPELNISERLQSYGSKMNPFNPPSAGASGQVMGANTSDPFRTGGTTPSTSFGDLLTQPQYQPSSGGQTSGGTGGYTGGDTGGGGGFDPTGDIRAAYDQARQAYEAQFPQLEGDYNRVRGDIEGAVGRAKTTLGEQKDDIGRGYGETLRNLLTNSNELGQKTRNVYSGLNALDSSSYADAQVKQEQGLYDTQTKLEAEKVRSNKEADRYYSEYESQANSQLAALGSQYMAGRQSLQQAIADNNVEEAQTIMNYLQNLQSTMTQAKLGLASLQSQGTDVIGSLQKLNRGGIDSIFGNYLSSVYKPGISGLSSVGAPQESGSGYISPRSGRRYGSYQEFLSAEG